VNGDHVLLAPPFIAGTEDLREIVRLLAESIAAVTEANEVAQATQAPSR
jgi:adenosylmethionine-8-amino-7-oxononanoate aminotransferase